MSLLGNVVHILGKGPGKVQKMLSLLDLSSTFPNTFAARKGVGKATFPAPFRLGKSGSMRGGNHVSALRRLLSLFDSDLNATAAAYFVAIPLEVCMDPSS